MRTTRAITAALLAIASLALAWEPAAAQTSGPATACPPGQPDGRPPGHPPNQPGPPTGRPPGYPIGTCNLRLSSSSVARGERVDIQGNGCAAGSGVRIELEPGGIDLGSTTADANGAFATSVIIPATARLGQNEVRAICDLQVLSAVLEVLPAGAAASGPGSGLLPRTGEDVMRVVSLGGSLVVLGAAMVIVVRRRRSLA